MARIEIGGNVYYGDINGQSTGKGVEFSARVGQACYTVCSSWKESHVTSTSLNGRYAIAFDVLDDGKRHILAAVILADSGYRASDARVMTAPYKNLELDFIFPTIRMGQEAPPSVTRGKK